MRVEIAPLRGAPRLRAAQKAAAAARQITLDPIVPIISDGARHKAPVTPVRHQSALSVDVFLLLRLVSERRFAVNRIAAIFVRVTCRAAGRLGQFPWRDPPRLMGI